MPGSQTWVEREEVCSCSPDKRRSENFQQRKMTPGWKSPERRLGMELELRCIRIEWDRPLDSGESPLTEDLP